jgi:phosphohistidine phosphatase
MELYILRHGIAEDKAARGKDADRALTADGRKKLAMVLKRAAKAGVKPSLIITSPYVRARQSAEIAAETLGYADPLLESKALIPGSSPQAIWEEVRNHRTEEQLLLAGHEPLLSQTVSYLLSAPTLEFDFKKGAIVCLRIGSFRGDPHGVLQWILTPKIAL